jgi:hypothetical protein
MDNQGISPGNSDQDVRRAAGACPHCGGRDIATGVRLTQTGQVRLSIGLAYKAAAIFTGAETLCADLCRACGTVLRFFVKEPGRNWIQQ